MERWVLRCAAGGDLYHALVRRNIEIWIGREQFFEG
jgi:hypothetical protein